MRDSAGATLGLHQQAARSRVADISQLEAIHARLARLPTRGDLARAALGIIFATTGLLIGWMEVFWR
jgi:hypothetical protein